MSKIEVNCPSCGKAGEIEEALLGQWAPCPHCKEQVVPAATNLQKLRSKTNYPELRAAIGIINLVGGGGLVTFGLLFLMQGFAYRFSTTTERSGGFEILTGIILLFLAAIWLKLWKAIASLLVDIADACINNHRES